MSDITIPPEALKAEVERLRAALDLYREAVRIDATMEGPKFMGSNASALKRAWDADRAALTQPAPVVGHLDNAETSIRRLTDSNND